jgi:hypothetical protein
MASFKGVDFNERQSAAANAKKALLEKFKAKAGPGDPEFEARQAERLAAAEARDARQRAAREKAAREAEAARVAKLKAEEEARIAAAAEEVRRKAEEEARYQADLIAKEELDAQKKAERDARYAARKARKRSGR